MKTADYVSGVLAPLLVAVLVLTVANLALTVWQVAGNHRPPLVFRVEQFPSQETFPAQNRTFPAPSGTFPAPSGQCPTPSGQCPTPPATQPEPQPQPKAGHAYLNGRRLW